MRMNKRIFQNKALSEVEKGFVSSKKGAKEERNGH